MAERTVEQIAADLDRWMSELGIAPGDPLAVDVNALCPRPITDRDLAEYVAAARHYIAEVPKAHEAAFDALAREVEPWQ